MRQVALRGLLAHKGRLIATLLAVTLGVAFVGGVLTLTDTMNRGFDDLVSDVYRDTDAVVRSDRTVGGGSFAVEQRATVDAALRDELAGVESVASAEGAIEAYSRIIGPDGDPVGNPAMGAPTFGANWLADEELNPFDLRAGNAPEAADEVVIDAASAESTGYQLGDTVAVQTAAGVGSFELVGIAGFGDADSAAGASYVFFTTEQAQELVLGEPGRFNWISVVAADGVSEDELTAELRSVVAADGGDGIEVLSGTQITEETKSAIADQLMFVTGFFMAFAVVAIVVGSFVIYNSFSIIVAQRTREMALLRALGASRRQVRRAVLVEAVVVGLVGAVAGYLLGLGLASLMATLFDAEGGLAILPTAFVVSLVVGLVVTLGSALIPARRASKVPPVAAMRTVSIDTTGRSRIRFAIGLVLLAAGVGQVIAGGLAATWQLVASGVGLALVGLIVAGPGLARPVSATLGWPMGRWRGVSGLLARQNAGRNPRRSAATAQALMIGVGIAAFFLVINASIRASIDKTLDENFSGDLIVDAGTDGFVGLPATVATEIAELDEVDQVAPLRMAEVHIDGDQEPLFGTTQDVFGLFGLDVVDGSGTLGEGEVVLLAEAARDQGLGVGDTLTVDYLETGPAELTVAGLYDGPEQAQLGDYLVGTRELAAHSTDDSDIQITVGLTDGVTLDQGRQAIEGITDPYPTAEVQTEDEFADAIGSQLDQMLQLLMGLLALSIVIALFGIGNTIALSVLERTRELGLLRAVGMSRRQLRSTVRWESVIIALLGTTLGLALGVLGGWGMFRALEEEGLEVFQLPVSTLIVVCVGAALSGMVAAAFPAWRASRLDVLDAIDAE